MGEEQKKSEEGKEEAKVEEKKVEAKADDAKDGGAASGGEGEKKESDGDGGGEEKKEETPLPPPEEIVMRVFMHCEGCARKVKRSLKGFDGVEDVTTDCKSHKVVVKGKKAAEDPMKVVDRIGKKTGRKVELLSPLPAPAKPEIKEEEKKEVEEKPKPEDKKEEPLVITVVLKVHMHCEACGQEMKKRILKMKGVQTAEIDLKASQVTVKGVFEAPKLVEYVYKRTGKHTVVVKQDPPEKKADDDKKSDAGTDAAKEEKKTDSGGDKASDGDKKDEKDGDKDKKDSEAADDASAAAAKMVEFMRNELQYNRMALAYHQYPQYAPQMFSDENPNACIIM